jgi:hypothetical protein
MTPERKAAVEAARQWAKERVETRTGVWGPYLAKAERIEGWRERERKRVEALRAQWERKAQAKFEWPWEREQRERKPS